MAPETPEAGPAELPPELDVPDHERRLRLRPHQWVGIPLLLLVPALAVLGFFGESWDEAEDAAGALALRVEYPSTYRYKQINTIRAVVANRSSAPLDTVIVAFDTAYMGRFSTISMIPAPREPFVLELTEMAPGEEKLVWAEVQAERYGRHRGTIRAWPAGAPDTARVVVSSHVLP